MRRPSRTALHDRAEIVVEQHDRRRLARHVGAAAAHGNADMRRLERRRVVDAVAGHGDDFAVGLQRIDDAQLLFGHDPREHGCAFARAAPVRRSLSASSSLSGHEIVGVEAGLPGDRPGGRRIVAGDHHHPDAGGAALGDGGGHALRAADRRGRPARELRRRNHAARPAMCCREGRRGRRPTRAGHRPPSRRPSASAPASSAASRWQSSAIASGAPLAATTNCRAAIG